MSETILRRDEIRPCDLCRQPHALPIVWRLTFDRIAIPGQATRTQAGLETMLGSPALAAVFSPVRDFGMRLMKTELIICEQCALKSPLAFAAMEKAGRDEAAADNTSTGGRS